jgi:hypothetical protein
MVAHPVRHHRNIAHQHPSTETETASRRFTVSFITRIDPRSIESPADMARALRLVIADAFDPHNTEIRPPDRPGSKGSFRWVEDAFIVENHSGENAFYILVSDADEAEEHPPRAMNSQEIALEYLIQHLGILDVTIALSDVLVDQLTRAGERPEAIAKAAAQADQARMDLKSCDRAPRYDWRRAEPKAPRAGRATKKTKATAKVK